MGAWKLEKAELGEYWKRKCWKYRVTGKDIDGDELSLAIVVNQETEHIDIVSKF